MTKTQGRDKKNPECPIRNILSRLGDKWSLLIIYSLQQHEVLRFKELHRTIPDISQKMLTSTLRYLVEDGLIERRVFAEVPPRVEYKLSARAEGFLPILESLLNWALTHQDAILKDRQKANSSQA